MASARDIKRRIKSVKSTQQITKAMKMVSASKLRKSQSTVQSIRPFAHKIEDVILSVSSAESEYAFLRNRDKVTRVCYLVIGSDRGLCGGFNSNLHRFLDHILAAETHDYDIAVIGRKVKDHCARMGYPVSFNCTCIGDNPGFYQAQELARIMRTAFERGDYDEIYVVYSEFKSAMSQTPRVKRLLPVQRPERTEENSQLKDIDYIFEPDRNQILDTILPQYIDIMVYSSLQEAKASEHGARMTTMSSATDNASDMISKLTLSLNRARQAAITTEISEIVGGAAALS